VIKPVEKPASVIGKNRGAYWLCKCSCGKETIVLSTYLITGDTKSCGCFRYLPYYEKPKLKGVGLLSQSMYSHLVWSAKKRGIEFSLTKEYLWNLFLEQKGLCFYTGVPITMNTRNNKKTASLDRLNSFASYVEENVVWCHKDINSMKWKKDEEEIFILCNAIAKKHPRADLSEIQKCLKD
jgi:hypothetical protein